MGEKRGTISKPLTTPQVHEKVWNELTSDKKYGKETRNFWKKSQDVYKKSMAEEQSGIKRDMKHIRNPERPNKWWASEQNLQDAASKRSFDKATRATGKFVEEEMNSMKKGGKKK